MNVEIAPISIDTTKTLARLFPSSREQKHDHLVPIEAGAKPTQHLLDNFFAADFLPPCQRARNGQMPSAAAEDSYGVRYVHHLASQAKKDVHACAESIRSELTKVKWEQESLEAILADSIAVQLAAEHDVQMEITSSDLSHRFWASKMPNGLWRMIHGHLSSNSNITTNDTELAVEILFIFSSWSIADNGRGAPSTRESQRVGLAMQLFCKHAWAGKRGSEMQRVRVGHKALMLLEVTWRLLVGDEHDAKRRIAGKPRRSTRRRSSSSSSIHDSAQGEDESDDEETVRGLQKTGLARDALRQIAESVEKYPLLKGEVQETVDSLRLFVHPFDGHGTRTAQLGRFGPMRKKTHVPPMPQQPLPVAQQLNNLLDQPVGDMPERQQHQQDMPPNFFIDRKPWFAEPPRAARDAIRTYVESARMDRTEREYAEWWRRLIHERGMPLGLTLNTATRKGTTNDVTINYKSGDPAARHRRSSSRSDNRLPSDPGDGSSRKMDVFEFRGIIETEDLPALEQQLDGRQSEVKWPAHTEPPEAQDAYDVLYKTLFPLLGHFCRAIITTIANWAPTEKELPTRQFLINVGPPQVSEHTCFGIVKYPRSDITKEAHGKADEKSASESNSSDSGNPVANERKVPSDTDKKKPDAAEQPSSRDVPVELAARLIAQYAQWQAVGSLMLNISTSFRANHALQADYLSQLLMNCNLIPALFWWIGTANLDICVDLPLSVIQHTFSEAYEAAMSEQAMVDEPDIDAMMMELGRDSGPPSTVDSMDDAEAATTRSTRRSLEKGAAGFGSSFGDDSDTETTVWTPALQGIHLCMRFLRLTTYRNGLRRGLLYKNKALHFYNRLLKFPSLPVRQVGAELYRDVMQVISKKQKQAYLNNIAAVYMYAPVALADTFWLADYSLDPHIEMHRHVELIRLLHFYHMSALTLKLPDDPSLFPSLMRQAQELSTVLPSPARDISIEKMPLGSSSSCGGEVAKEEWLQWESDLEETLEDVTLQM
ncbi:hypothetical protein DL89DRAFT_269990 [Linderina pennispora]|uniref:Far11/STRP C-terminal domain-containing protein n=1 Tax=Linderina pennispora TaxID=61395 RepID=A0A1Y1VYU0_9FUNG|nr:uncharacterized protein DL89DRAFT_269990 [Linderina pennispora]ORX66429.1 hypothetical protein DL89DRAFT_269990 [Linderina pennispora]